MWEVVQVVISFHWGGGGISGVLQVVRADQRVTDYLRVMIDIEGGSTKLVQHSAYRGSSNRRKGAASHIFVMVWLYRSPIPVGEPPFLFVHIKTTFQRGA